MPKPKLSTTQRGYGTEHKRLRDALLKTAYGTPCTRCGQLMIEGQPLDLDHADDRTSYLGFAHRRCNRAAGARKANARRRRRLATSRDW